MRRRSRTATRQQDLPLDRSRHGGARAGAGRKPKPGRRRVAHVARPTVKPRFAVHVTARVRRDVPRLRNFELARVLQRAFVRGCKQDGFRICQFSIQGNHIHLICEARDASQLARGVQGWSVRVARGLNARLGRHGAVFDDRYHAEVIATPRHMRNTLCYVLQNARRHGERLDRAYREYGGIDPFSSACWFDGWADDRWRRGVRRPDEPPVAPARSWLLTTAWRRHGRIGVTEVPAAARARS